jgi:hypothetical protein
MRSVSLPRSQESRLRISTAHGENNRGHIEIECDIVRRTWRSHLVSMVGRRREHPGPEHHFVSTSVTTRSAGAKTRGKRADYDNLYTEAVLVAQLAGDTTRIPNRERGDGFGYNF